MIPGLFDEPPPERVKLAERLAGLARRNVFLGTSSWRYDGWLGQIYTPERYVVRGKFSQKRFEAECIAEYAETFPVVCGDFSFYQFPSAEYWARLFRTAPEPLLFAFKAPEEITAARWPVHARYGARAGLENPSFLDPAIFAELFLTPLEAYRHRMAAVILEFGTFSQAVFANEAAFVRKLDPFLSALPAGFRYSVEIRNAEFLGPEYLGCLRDHGVAHVFNAWTRMPELEAQVAMPGAFTAGFTVTRALLRQGRAYEEAVRKFQPYAQAKEVNQRGRSALRGLIQRGLDAGQATFVFVNNRFEGNAPQTIAAITEEA